MNDELLTDDGFFFRGRMIPEELEKLVVFHKSQGHLPFFVNATTGTTVYGAFDPVPEIADICERHHIWLHIDVSHVVLLRGVR